jgi:hypothetical protein
MVGWLNSIPADRSHTHASPPAWLATTLSRRSRIGSDNAFNLPANSIAASADNGSRANGATSQPDTPINGSSDFDIHLYLQSSKH